MEYLRKLDWIIRLLVALTLKLACFERVVGVDPFQPKLFYESIETSLLKHLYLPELFLLEEAVTYEMVILAVLCSCRIFLIKEGLGYSKATMVWI